jgi:hypothetical protein
MRGFFLTRYTRCTFYLFGRPDRFKPALENQAVFPLLEPLANEFRERGVLRVRRVVSFLSHVLGGLDDPVYSSQDHTGINRGSSAKNAEMAMTETIPTEHLPFLGTQTATTVIATTIQHQPIVSVSSFLPCKNERKNLGDHPESWR